MVAFSYIFVAETGIMFSYFLGASLNVVTGLEERVKKQLISWKVKSIEKCLINSIFYAWK